MEAHESNHQEESVIMLGSIKMVEKLFHV